MDSRIRRQPPTIFEAFAEIQLNNEHQPCVSWLFPSADAVDETTLQNMQLFAFPTKTCNKSWLPWFDMFYKLLEKLGEVRGQADVTSLESCLSTLYALPVPLPSHTVLLPLAGFSQPFIITAPATNHLPQIPNDRNLREYFNAVDVVNMIIVYASMLHERRILFVSSKLGRLTSCVHASSAFLYPMFWQHLFIPVLPPALREYCSAPMPYIMGVHSSFFEEFQCDEQEEVVTVNVDSNEVYSPFNDVADLPDELMGILQSELNLQASVVNHNHILGDKLSRAFLRANIALIGGYRDSLKFRQGSPIVFDSASFIQSRPAGMRPFLERVLQLQLFVQFITERLNLLNSGQGFTDEFENESTMMIAGRPGPGSPYIDWLADMKKCGRKLRMDGKVSFTTAANKLSSKAGTGTAIKVTPKTDDVNKEVRVPTPETVTSKVTKAVPPQRPPRPSLPPRSVPSTSASVPSVSSDTATFTNDLIILDSTADKHDLDTKLSNVHISANTGAVVGTNKFTVDYAAAADRVSITSTTSGDSTKTSAKKSAEIKSRSSWFVVDYGDATKDEELIIHAKEVKCDVAASAADAKSRSSWFAVQRDDEDAAAQEEACQELKPASSVVNDNKVIKKDEEDDSVKQSEVIQPQQSDALVAADSIVVNGTLSDHVYTVASHETLGSDAAPRMLPPTVPPRPSRARRQNKAQDGSDIIRQSAVGMAGSNQSEGGVADHVTNGQPMSSKNSDDDPIIIQSDGRLSYKW